MSKKLGWTVVPVLLLSFAVWLCGYDFGQREPLAGVLFVICALYAAWQWFAPWWCE